MAKGDVWMYAAASAVLVAGVLFLAPGLSGAALALVLGLWVGYFLFMRKGGVVVEEVPYAVLRAPIYKEQFAADPLHYRSLYKAYYMNAERDYKEGAPGERVKDTKTEKFSDKADVVNMHLGNSLSVEECIEYLCREYARGEVRLHPNDFDRRACEIRVKPKVALTFERLAEKAVEAGEPVPELPRRR